MADVFKITNLRLGEISLVDDGDDPHAHVMIVKRRPGALDAIAKLRSELAEGAADISKGAPMKTIEELTAALDAIEKSVEAKDVEIAKFKGESEAKDAEITKLKGERDEAIEKAKGAPAGDSEEEVLKAMPPAIQAIVKASRTEAAAATAAIEKMRDDTEVAGQVEIAKSLKLGKPDEMGALLARIKKGKTTEADHTAIVEVLKASATISKESPLFRTAGSASAADATDPEAILKERAEAIMKAKPGTTFPVAYTEAMDADPALYTSYVEKRRKA